MSVFKELEELVAKLSRELSPDDGPAAPKLVTHDEWDDLIDRLDDATKALQLAAAALRESADPPAPGADVKALETADRTTDPVLANALAEVTTDLARESVDLRRRAAIRRSLAPPDPVEEKPASPREGGHPGGETHPSTKAPKTDRDKVPVKKVPLRGIRKCVDRLDAAQKSLATAMDHLSTGPDDKGAAAFAEDLDVLAEMMLGLRRRVDEISEVPGD